MNTLIHLWRSAGYTNERATYAILDTPMHPARFYFGPVLLSGSTHEADEWIPVRNETHRYHHTLTQARGAAAMAGLDILATSDTHPNGVTRGEQPSFILVDNLRSALALAIESLKKTDARHGPAFRCALRAGFEDNLAALRAGQPLTIRYS